MFRLIRFSKGTSVSTLFLKNINNFKSHGRTRFFNSLESARLVSAAPESTKNKSTDDCDKKDNEIKNIFKTYAGQDDRKKQINRLMETIKDECPKECGKMIIEHDFNEEEKNTLRRLIRHQVNIIDSRINNRYIQSYPLFISGISCIIWLGPFIAMPNNAQNCFGILVCSLPLIMSFSKSQAKCDSELFKEILKDLEKDGNKKIEP
jgi:hypothetical protein